MYDACHYLMVPMHYAFYNNDGKTIKLFADFFSRFVSDVTGDDLYQFQQGGTLNKLHFFYLCTQYMNLCATHGYDSHIPNALPALAQNFAENYLLHTRANWGTEQTVITHMQCVINGKVYDANYKSTIEDLDQFTLAILCDLKYLHLVRRESYAPVLDTAADLAYQIFSSPTLNQETEKGGWLFQPGCWSDHPDYAYAGNPTVFEGIEPLIRADVPWDSSHFHRFPLFLNSWQSAQPNKERQALFQLRKEQLANQMAEYVLQNIDGRWLTTTFMDGTNGVYRYSYNTEGVGLDGYDLSGTFLFGWWAFLHNEHIAQCYRDILKTFPMEANRSNPYFDHATVREQNPFFDMDTAFDNGMFECIVTCASKLTDQAYNPRHRTFFWGIKTMPQLRGICNGKSLPCNQRSLARGYTHFSQGMRFIG